MMRRWLAAFIVFALAWGAPAAHAAIGTPFQIGTAAGTSGTATITTTSDTPVGTLVVVASGGNSSDTLTSVVDNKSNCTTYAAAQNSGVTNEPTLSLFYCVTTIDLPTGSTITATLSASSNLSITAFGVSGIMSPGPLDGTGTLQGSVTVETSATSTSTGELSQASEIIVGAIALFGSASSITPGGSFTTIGGTTSASFGIFPAYQVVTSNAAVSWAPTWSPSASYQSNVFAFKAAGVTRAVLFPTAIP